MRLAQATFEEAQRHHHPWGIGEIGFWLWRLAELAELPPTAAEPYRSHAAGDLASAARAWDELGCPYEAASVRIDMDDTDEVSRALTVFERLGAAPAAAAARRRLRELGVRGVRRGPRPTTSVNPAGLTARQLEVLGLLVEGLRDADIAQRLYISEKTVGHHVSAVLRKLGVRSRSEAATLALQDGLVPSPAGTSPPRPVGGGPT